jgi:hypothetical protein
MLPILTVCLTNNFVTSNSRNTVNVIICLMLAFLSESQRPEHTTSAHITKNCVFVIIIGVWEKCPKISMSQKNILKFWQKGIM